MAHAGLVSGRRFFRVKNINLIQAQSSLRPALSLWGLIEVGSALLCAATVTGFLARLWWVFELSSHFRLHLALGLAALTLLWLLKRRRRMVSLCGFFALVNAVLVTLVFFPVETANVTDGGRLRLVSFNVHTENIRMAEALKFLQDADADVILLMEVNDEWMTNLQPLRAQYSWLIAEPREDNFGIALFSRLPWTNSAVLELGAAEVPSLATTIWVAGRKISLLGTHPLPPGSAAYARQRNLQLQAIARWARGQDLPTVVLGDLNCTPLEPVFHRSAS